MTPVRPRSPRPSRRPARGRRRGNRGHHLHQRAARVLNPRTFRSGGEGAAAVPGYALVRRGTCLHSQGGRNLLRVSDVARAHRSRPPWPSNRSRIPQGTRVVEQSFEFDLTSTSKLLSRISTRTFPSSRRRDRAAETVSGTLVGTQGGLILKGADGSVRIVKGTAGINLPSLPGGLISKPTLVWDVETATRGVTTRRASPTRPAA